MSSIELCRQLTAIDSSVSHGTHEIAEFVASQARAWGLAVELQHENLNGVANANIILRPVGQIAPQSLLLVSRMDTLDPGDYGYWVRTGANPFNASLDGENLYGLGLADAKADLACKLQALRAMQAKAFNEVSPAVLGTFGLGSGAGAIRFIRKKSTAISAAIVGAPTQMQIANKGPGYAKVEICVPFSAGERDYRQRHNLSEASVSQSKMFVRKERDHHSHNLSNNPVLRLIEYLKNLPRGMSIISIEAGVNYETEPDSAFLEIDLVDSFDESINSKLISIG